MKQSTLRYTCSEACGWYTDNKTKRCKYCGAPMWAFEIKDGGLVWYY